MLPNFNALSPVKVGSIANFSLSPINRTDQFAMRFTTRIKIPTNGSYTFYTTIR